MLIDVKERIAEETIKELLEYAIYPDPEKLDNTLNEYQTDPHLELMAIEDDGEVLGIVGFRHADRSLIIQHIAVNPECRGMGYGRGLILELIELKNPDKITVETDEDAVEFYRNIGFSISSLGEKYPGVERYQCEYHI